MYIHSIAMLVYQRVSKITTSIVYIIPIDTYNLMPPATISWCKAPMSRTGLCYANNELVTVANLLTNL